jgi:hypothetical protein
MTERASDDDMHAPEFRRWFYATVVHSHHDHTALTGYVTNVPITGMFLDWPATIASSLLQKMAFEYAMREIARTFISTALNPWKLVSSILSQVGRTIVPDSRQQSQSIDEAIDAYAKKGENSDFFKQASDAKQSIMVLVVSILLFYFQYLGMTTMKDANTKYQKITALIDVNSDEIYSSKQNPNSLMKKILFQSYNSNKYYKKQEGDDTLSWKDYLNPRQYNAVRIVYNTLVGINSTLFSIIGGQSTDPSHEIMHWAKVLLYWEVIARLLVLHGLGPVQLATHLFLHDIVAESKAKKPKGWF